MSKHRKHKRRPEGAPFTAKKAHPRGFAFLLFILLGIALLVLLLRSPSSQQGAEHQALRPSLPAVPTEKWLQRAYAIDALFHQVYTPCWEGAYGAIGDAHLFAVTRDSALLRFYTLEHPLTEMCRETWLDDQAWVCLAEMYWWHFTGKTNMALVADAVRRYEEARAEGRLSNHEGFWSWYNWPPGAKVPGPIFTNSNMNQMVSVACWLYEVTREKHYLEDALLVWNGDGHTAGVEKYYYRGKGKWQGKAGPAAFGNPLPWLGAGYCSIGASLYRVTKDPKYRAIAGATAKRIMDPGTGWVDSVDFYQLRMDGNGAFVNFLIDAYLVAPEELPDIPQKVERMLEHVWSNAHGRSTLTLHRESDHGIRNGWNGRGGEEGYGVGEVGTVHAQGEAVRAFGLYAYLVNAVLKTR